MKITHVATRFDPTTDKRYANILLMGKKWWNACQCVIFTVTPIVSNVWFFTFACMQKYEKDIHKCIYNFFHLGMIFSSHTGENEQMALCGHCFGSTKCQLSHNNFCSTFYMIDLSGLNKLSHKVFFSKRWHIIHLPHGTFSVPSVAWWYHRKKEKKSASCASNLMHTVFFCKKWPKSGFKLKGATVDYLLYISSPIQICNDYDFKHGLCTMATPQIPPFTLLCRNIYRAPTSTKKNIYETVKC
jgi:hypothetical protein